MDGRANQSECTSQHEQFLAPLCLEIPSFPPLTVDDSSEWRAQAHEASPHLIPPITSPSKKKSKTASLAFSPGASKSSFRRESSPAPTASSIASEDRKGSQDSMSRTPAPGPPKETQGLRSSKRTPTALHTSHVTRVHQHKVQRPGITQINPCQPSQA